MFRELPSEREQTAWSPNRRELLDGAIAWWELDEYGGGFLVKLLADGTLVWLEGNEPHPGYRRNDRTYRMPAREFLATRACPAGVTDAFRDEILADLRGLI